MNRNPKFLFLLGSLGSNNKIITEEIINRFNMYPLNEINNGTLDLFGCNK